MATSQRQSEGPFSRALQKWISEVKRDASKTSPFYEKVLASQGAISVSANGIPPEACAQKYADDLASFIRELEKRRRQESRTIRLGAKLQPFVDGLSHMMVLCSTIVQAAPFEIAIAFVGAQLVLQLATRHADTFNRMVSIMDEIAVNLHCYERFGTVYAASDDIQKLLVDAYMTIIAFWHRASRVLSQKSFRIALTNLLKPIDVEWQACLDSLQTNSRRVVITAQSIEAVKSEESRKAELTRKVADWIIGGEDSFKLDFRVDRLESQTMRQEGTCSWLFSHKTFESWYESNSNVVAWYYAPPGSGKTILSAAVAHHLEKQDRRVVYFRYSYDDKTRREPLSSLRSIALQLQHILDRIPDPVLAEYEREVSHHTYDLQDAKTAVKIVQTFIKHLPRIHIVVDGLDECSDKEKALAIFRELVAFPTYGVIKWFFTSRDEPAIRAMMKDIKAKEVSPPKGAIMSDITMYLDGQGEKRSQGQCASCIRYWTAASQENFLYSKLMFDILCGDGVTCSDEIHEELQRFPPGLTGCYMRCVEDIARRSERERELARRTFVLMVYAAQPLTTSSLRNALAVQLDSHHDDHQPGRVPSLDLILSLCGSLVKLEDSRSEQDEEQIIKFVHKSVPDFLKDDPTRLGITRDELRCFFVDERRGDLELGRICLKYLQYRRYQVQTDILRVLDYTDEEHSFLMYAAAFWFEHLSGVDHSEQLFAEVKTFVQSSAFRTFLAILSKVRPHLFCRYTKAEDGFMLGLDRGQLEDGDSIACLLPDWLELYEPDGPAIIRVFYDFIKEWHEVLGSYPEATGQCVMDQNGRMLFPALASMESKNIRLCSIRGPADSSAAALAEVFFKKSKLHTRIIFRNANGWGWREGPASSLEQAREGQLQMPKPHRNQSGRLTRFSNGYNHSTSSCLATWSIRLDDLAVEYSNGEEAATATLDYPGFCSATKFSKSEWSLVAESASTLEGGSSFGFHMVRSKSESARQETDSAYYSNSAWSDSEDDSDEERDALEATNCLVICCDGEKPVWIPWNERKDHQSQIRCAFHPKRKIAVWSRSLDELQVLDLGTGAVITRAIEEPAAASASASIMCREMHFSECGQYLYYLLIMFADNGDVGSTCRVFLTTFPFNESDDDMLRSDLTVERLTYKLRDPTSSLRVPYVLSHWNAENLYLCLPLFSYNPKIVRLALLGRQAEAAGQAVAGASIQTLASHIFFPSSTPSRKPRILYRPSTSGNMGVFVLALDSLQQSDGDGGNDYPPAVLEWKIHSKGGWRAWEEDVDEEENGLAAQARTYEMLRGTFINADRRFNVVVRSGLNWTKKAFLSCA